MNSKESTSAKFYANFRLAMRSFLNCAHIYLRKGEFKKMTKYQQMAVGRAFANLNAVAENPHKYLSRECTETAWNMRAQKCAQEKKLDSIMDAYYIVQSPSTLVWVLADDLHINAELSNEFFRLCEDFMQWEYHRTAVDEETAGFMAARYADKLNAHLDFFKQWEHKHITVCQEWQKAKRQNPIVKTVCRKARQICK